jgi:HNH endonuclease
MLRHTVTTLRKTDIPLEVEHINPRSQSRDDRICNLTLACAPCNHKKANQDIRVFLAHKPDVALGVPMECGSGGRTKYNRVSRGLEKAHWLDATCVGVSTPEHLHMAGVVPLLVTANGHGSRQMCLMDKHGFPRSGPKQAKRVNGFQTGDMVKAVVPSGVKSGTYVGRVAVRATGSFNITTKEGKTVQGIRHRHCTALHRCDGYSYQKGEAAFPPAP